MRTRHVVPFQRAKVEASPRRRRVVKPFIDITSSPEIISSSESVVITKVEEKKKKTKSPEIISSSESVVITKVEKNKKKKKKNKRESSDAGLTSTKPQKKRGRRDDDDDDGGGVVQPASAVPYPAGSTIRGSGKRLGSLSSPAGVAAY